MKAFFFIVIVLISNYVISQDISGDWRWQFENGKHITSLTIKKELTSGIFKGNYCSVFFEGSKIDCNDNNDAYSFNFKLIDTNIYKGTFESISHQGSGKIILNYNPISDTLSFEIISGNGIYYLPEKAVFER